MNAFLSISTQHLSLYKFIQTLIVLSVSFLSVNSNAQQNNLIADSPFSIPNETFLTVDEAYELSVRQTDTEIIAEWVITDAYFLYGEQFRFSIDGKNVSADRAPGEISYDTIFEKDVEKYYIYTQSTIDKTQLDLPAQNPLTLSITYQGCADAGLCYPPETKQFAIDTSNNTVTSINISAPQGNSSTANASIEEPSINHSWLLTLLMLGAALAGGVLLNLMPCVFPVLSIKALSLTNNTNRQSRIQHAWVYTLGCLVTFVLVASVLLIVRNAGEAVGWGYQLQSPAVITFLIFLFFVMGLSLSGFVTLGGRWMGAGQNLTQGNKLSHSFFTGVLAAVVASPCTAPFMAPALGYALTQPAAIALCIFAFLGLGMALPFLLLSYLPQLSKHLPTPGPWMDTFKQAVAFPLYLTSAWLLWVLGQQVGNDGVALAVIGAIGISFLLWLSQKKPQWFMVTTSLIVVLAISVIWHNKTLDRSTPHYEQQNTLWQPYTQQTLDQLRSEGKAVFINLTADWCITCKVNEKLVFTPTALSMLQDNGIHLLEGDWTNYNPEITSLLDRYKRAGVPLYLFFAANPDAKAVILPQILTSGTLKSLVTDF